MQPRFVVITKWRQHEIAPTFVRVHGDELDTVALQPMGCPLAIFRHDVCQVFGDEPFRHVDRPPFQFRRRCYDTAESQMKDTAAPPGIISVGLALLCF